MRVRREPDGVPPISPAPTSGSGPAFTVGPSGTDTRRVVALPSGVVTFLFTDIEGSTRLLQELGGGYTQVLAEHRRVVRASVAAHDGVEVDTQGDAFLVAFARASDAVAAAREAQAALVNGPVRVRMGIHTGEPTVTAEGYVGIDVHRGARVCAAGHGGQVLLSQRTRSLIGPDVAVRDLGEHRLKDLEDPEWLYQLIAPGLEAVFPALRSAGNTNLPQETSQLIGRENELAELGAALDREEIRLLTLTGPGGTGKTRLALRLAADRLDRFPNGVFLVTLAAITDPALVLPAVAQALGLKEMPGQTTADRLRRHLQGKRVLLVLDNFEQVVAAAPAVGALLASVAQLKILVTSRERLRLAAEHEFVTQPLPDNEAVTLFGARAHAAEPTFSVDAHRATVRAICRRLDGLPLAVELAAARVKLFAPELLRASLERSFSLLTDGPRDHPRRQQTLQATIDWSYDLLSAEEQRVFAALGVFSGGCTFEAAERICGTGVDTIASLLDKSLVRRANDRYVMLETVRDYAAGRLDRSGCRREVTERHTTYYSAYAKQALEYSTGYGGRRLVEPREIRNAKQAVWLDRLAEDHDNLRAALERLVVAGDVAQAAGFVFGMHGFWRDRGLLREGRGWTERVLDLPGVEAFEELGVLLTVAGEFPRAQGDLERARTLKEGAIERLRGGPRRGILAGALNDLAGIVGQQGDRPRARALYEESLAIRRELGIPEGIGHTLAGLAALLLRMGQEELAQEAAQEAIALQRSASAEHLLAHAQFTLAEILRHRGVPQRAVALYREALAVNLRFGRVGATAECLDGVADIAGARGDFQRATMLWAASQRLLDQAGQWPWDLDEATKGRQSAKRALGSAFEAAWQTGEAMTLEEAAACAAEVAAAVEGT